MWGLLLGFGCWISQPCEWQINVDTPLLVGQPPALTRELRSTRITLLGNFEEGWVDVSATVRLHGFPPRYLQEKS